MIGSRNEEERVIASKYIFLDEYVWINIRRHLCGDNNCGDMEPVVRKLCEKIKNDTWILPLSQEHIIETYNTGDGSKRMTLGYVMGALSKGYTICPYKQLLEHEIVCLEAGLRPTDSPEQIIKKDFMHAFGRDTQSLVEEIAEADKIQLTPDIKNKISSLLDVIPGEHFAHNMKIYSGNQSSKAAQRECLVNLIKYNKMNPYKSLNAYLVEMVEVFYDTNQKERIKKNFCQRLSETKKPVQRDVEKLFQELPFFYTFCAISYQYILQKEEDAVKENDFIDMQYLAFAIPYFDIAIIEKSWKNIVVQQLHLDKLFKTEVSSLLSDLMKNN